MKKIPPTHFFDIYRKVPRLCVEIVIIKDGGVLLTLRNILPAKGLWHFPGGTVFYDESVLDAVHRIAKDELGITVKIVKFLDYVDWHNSKNAVGHSVSLLFLAKITKGVIKVDFQAKEAKFFKKLPKNIIEENKIFIEGHLADNLDSL